MDSTLQTIQRVLPTNPTHADILDAVDFSFSLDAGAAYRARIAALCPPRQPQPSELARREDAISSYILARDLGPSGYKAKVAAMQRPQTVSGRFLQKVRGLWS